MKATNVQEVKSDAEEKKATDVQDVKLDAETTKAMDVQGVKSDAEEIKDMLDSFVYWIDLGWQAQGREGPAPSSFV